MRLGWLARPVCCLCCIHSARHFEGLSSECLSPLERTNKSRKTRTPYLSLLFSVDTIHFFLFIIKGFLGLTVSYGGVVKRDLQVVVNSGVSVFWCGVNREPIGKI